MVKGSTITQIHASNDLAITRITKPYGRGHDGVDSIWTIYSRSFPLTDQREPKYRLRSIVKDPVKDTSKRYDESFLASAAAGGRVVGGTMFDYADGTAENGNLAMSFGMGWYIFVDENHRGRGYGTKIHTAQIKMLDDKAFERGRKLELLLAELGDPAKMNAEEIERDRLVMDPFERLRFWNHRGYSAIDPKSFAYIQSQIVESTEPYSGLILAVNPRISKLQRQIPVDYLKQMLWLYTWAGFAGISGSDIDDHRNPDTDEAYKEMRRQLDFLEKKRISNLPLVPLVG